MLLTTKTNKEHRQDSHVMHAEASVVCGIMFVGAEMSCIMLSELPAETG